MGGTTFQCEAEGRTATDAFNRAVDDARHEHGHGRYTGTIAEKDGFKLFVLPDGVEVDTVLELLGQGIVPFPSIHSPWFERVFKVYDDKWGPAVCLEMPCTTPGMKRFVFCGWAST